SLSDGDLASSAAHPQQPCPPPSARPQRAGAGHRRARLLWRGWRRAPAGPAALAVGPERRLPWPLWPPRATSRCRPVARVATSPRFGRSIGFLAAHSPRVQSTCPAPAGVATFPVRFGRPIGFLAAHSPRVQSTCPAPAGVATFPVRFGRPIGFLATHSPPSATVPRAGLSSPTAPAIFPVRVAV